MDRSILKKHKKSEIELKWKYLRQILIIGGITFAGEMLHFLLPMPVPASVYGMALLFFCLCLHVVKEEQIAETAEWLLAVMPVMFIGPGVGIY